MCFLAEEVSSKYLRLTILFRVAMIIRIKKNKINFHLALLEVIFDTKILFFY